MIYVLIGMSLLFISLGYLVTEKNAKYLLSGYNTLNEEERKKVDIHKYIPYFKKFHLFLGISFFVLGTFLTYFIGENAGGVFLAIYPILAYIFFSVTSSSYSKGLNKKWNIFGISVLVGALLLVVSILWYGLKESKIIFDSEKVSFQGIYGETLTKREIYSIELVNQLPEIVLKTNGFALGTIHKGYFKTNNGEIVKLILNSNSNPIVLFTKTDGKKIYYSAKDISNKQLFDELDRAIPINVTKR